MLLFVPDHLKTQEMCHGIMRKKPAAFHHIPDRFKTQETCIKATRKMPWQLKHVPDCFKTQEMCNKTGRDGMREGILFFFAVCPWLVCDTAATKAM